MSLRASSPRRTCKSRRFGDTSPHGRGPAMIAAIHARKSTDQNGRRTR